LDYSDLANLYEKLDKTAKRLEMTDILVDFFKIIPSNIIDKVIYLTQGKLYPDWNDLPELGIAEKMAIKSVSTAFGISENKIISKMKELMHKRVIEDLGGLVSKIKSKKQKSLFDIEAPSIEEIYNDLVKIAKESGSGANKRKIDLLAGILVKLDPKDAKWVIRTIEGKMRIGVADKTIIDALSIAYTGDKENKDAIELGYNKFPDLGFVAKTLAIEGFEGIKKIKITLGTPLKSMLASRVKDVDEVLEKLGNKCAIEYKYDGMRIQAHCDNGKISFFSRNLENITEQFPDVKKYLQQIKAKKYILDGECVSIDEQTGKLKPFQELMHRRRKFDIEKMAEEYVVNYFLFDILYLDGKDLTELPYLERKKILKSMFKENHLKMAKYTTVDNVEDFLEYFQDSLKQGSEGLIAKSIDEKSIYKAGSRGYIWIKFKHSYQEKIADTIDLTIVGANLGKGKWAGGYGALFGAIYDDETGEYVVATKIASGFSEENLKEFMERLEPLKINKKDERVVPPNNIKLDQWFKPKLVIEVRGDEISLSPTYHVAMDQIKKNSGLSIRFPRFIQIREDKNPEDATTTKEIIDLYRQQEKS